MLQHWKALSASSENKHFPSTFSNELFNADFDALAHSLFEQEEQKMKFANVLVEVCLELMRAKLQQTKLLKLRKLFISVCDVELV